MSNSKENKAARDAYNAYMRQWRAAHPDAVKKINATYWRNRTARMAAQAAAAQTAQDGGADT